MAFERDVEHYSRHVSWGGEIGDGDIILFGYDYSGATFLLSLASEPGATPAISIGNAVAGTEGVSAVLEDPFINPESGEEGIATVVTMQIDDTTFEGLAWAEPPQPLVFYYDLLVTPTGESRRVVCYGTFTIYPGVGD